MIDLHSVLAGVALVGLAANVYFQRRQINQLRSNVSADLQSICRDIDGLEYRIDSVGRRVADVEHELEPVTERITTVSQQTVVF